MKRYPMIRPWSSMLLLPLLWLPAQTAEPAPGNMDRAVEQFRAYLLAQGTTIARAAEQMAALRDDGTWADIDYASQQRATWPTGQHVSRMLQMAIAWRQGGGKDAPPDALLAAVHRAFAHWRLKDYQCPNWWYNQIGGPQNLFSLGLVLGDALQPDEFTYLAETVLPRVKIGMTGQNRVWLAGNTLMAGLLLRDAQMVGEAARAIYSEVVITTGEGIQPDYSFHQHGAQQQFGNYGQSFAGDQVKWATILRDTPWAMPEAERRILREYLLNGSAWVLWRGALDISACGRQLSPRSPVSKGAALLRILDAMARIDPQHADAFTAAVRRNAPGAANDQIGNRYFWRSEYQIHRRPEFCLTLKLSSERVIGVESLNSENLSGYYLADGACFIYRDGGEYADIFPAWNWRQVPGVTCPQEAGPMPAFSTNRLPTSWVGGISDGLNGGMAVDYAREAAQDGKRFAAKKAWFCFDDQVVCLGAGIEASVADPLLTTVNQCRLRGPVRISDGNAERVLEAGAARPDALQWVEHDGVRYRFLGPQQVVLSAGPRTGTWHAVQKTSNLPLADITLDVFHLAVEHGRRPAGGSYAYVIQPTDPDRQPAVELLHNTPQLQAVRVGTRIQAACYAAGTFAYAPGRTLTVDAPCLLLFDTAARCAYVADPLEQRRMLTITIDAVPYAVALPQEGLLGRPQAVELK